MNAEITEELLTLLAPNATAVEPEAGLALTEAEESIMSHDLHRDRGRDRRREDGADPRAILQRVVLERRVACELDPRTLVRRHLTR